SPARRSHAGVDSRDAGKSVRRVRRDAAGLCSPWLGRPNTQGWLEGVQSRGAAGPLVDGPASMDRPARNVDTAATSARDVPGLTGLGSNGFDCDLRICLVIEGYVGWWRMVEDVPRQPPPSSTNLH